MIHLADFFIDKEKTQNFWQDIFGSSQTQKCRIIHTDKVLSEIKRNIELLMNDYVARGEAKAELLQVEIVVTLDNVEVDVKFYHNGYLLL